MHYTDLVGTYATAYADVLANGGQLYPGNGKDSANVVVRGQHCFTYWAKGSKRRQEVVDLCRYFNLDPYGKTGGRIARWLIDDLLKLPYKQTFWQKQYRDLAKQGGHWHYTYVESGKSFIGIEVDLKSAYMVSLFAGKSLLYQQGKGYFDDQGALENLQVLTPELPKWFRLQLLGCLASWRITFLARDKKNLENKELTVKQFHEISYGAAFNAVHRAILRNYKLMQKIHQIGGQYIRRIHTDSFFMDCDIPPKLENLIWEYMESKQAQWDIKGCGYSYFFDLNTGFIGKRIVGSALEVVDLMREKDIKKNRSSYDNETFQRFKDKIETSTLPEKEPIPDQVLSLPSTKQLAILPGFEVTLA